MKTVMQPSFLPSKRKYLFLCDPFGMKQLSPIIQKVMKENLSFEMVFIGEKEETEISHWLQNQRMGSYLYIALEWGNMEFFGKIAEASGFSDEESQFTGHGVRIIDVFCCKCHQKTKVISELVDQTTTCSHCHLKLSVSEHYSPLRESYLGYAGDFATGSDQVGSR